MNLRLQHIYNFHVSKLFGSDLHLFELSVWLQAFGLALISVFIPIILFQLGLSITEIIVFYVIYHIVDIPLNLVAKRVIESRGARFTVIAATISLVLYFIVLFNLNNNWFLVVLLALLLAIYDAFYWVGHLYIFANSAHKNSHLRADVGMLKAVRILGGLVAPIVGAYILIYMSDQTLIFVSTIIMMASLIPLFRMRHLVFKPELPRSSFMEFFKRPKERINYLLTALSALRMEVGEVLWPFFIFFVYGSLKAVAYIPMLIALSSLMLTFLAEKLSIQRNIYKMVAWGSLVVAIIWSLRLAFYNHEFFAIGSVLIIALMSVLIDVPLEVSIFRRATETNPLAAMTYLNLVRMAIRAALYVALLIILSLKGDIFMAAFWVITALMFFQFFYSLKVSKHSLSQHNTG